VILDRRKQSVNSAAYSYFSSHAVEVTWSTPRYRYTHQKTVIVDGSEAVIMTANLTSRYYATSRDFLVVDTNRAGEYDRAYSRLARAGIRISYYGSSTGFYIHGKVIEADYGAAHAKIFIGSENFSSTSLNDNRELGLIVSDHTVMSAIASTFASDFRNGQHWP
jgi:phosphatidylserine/phosphatidylglycerophosphate/cardiolipin synthase-like enzyme